MVGPVQICSAQVPGRCDPHPYQAYKERLEQTICKTGQLYLRWRIVGLDTSTFAVQQENSS